jgi:hypothetical protein
MDQWLTKLHSDRRRTGHDAPLSKRRIDGVQSFQPAVPAVAFDRGDDLIQGRQWARMAATVGKKQG